MIHRMVMSVLAAIGIASGTAAQGVTISGSSSAQFVELRPLVLDSATVAATDSISPILRRAATGALTNCAATDAYCYFYRSMPRNGLVAMMQDLDVTAWGFGQGLSFHGQLRARTAAGSGRQLWPQADQSFDALSAYLQLERPGFDVRAGRQWVTSGLGVFNFDGGALDVRPFGWWDVNVYGGRSLVQGLDRPLGAAALSPVEDLPPPDNAYLVGAILQLRDLTAGSLRLQYQREIESNRSALYSERMAADATLLLGRATLAGEMTRDFATGAFNDLALSLGAMVVPQVHARIEARHYAPFFDLWTIWGAFAPVGYNEGTLATDWSSANEATLISLTGGWRQYDQTHTGFESLPLRSNGWRVGTLARQRLSSVFSLEGDYNVDLGFGASSTDGDLAIRWAPSSRGSLGIRGMAFQNLNEFTVGAGHVLGAGFEGSLLLRPDLRLAGDALVYRHVGDDAAQIADWNQRRLSLRLEWSLGAEPGLSRTLGRAGVP